MERAAMENGRKAGRILAHILTILYGTACLWLYYHQSVADLSGQGALPYQSDLPLHISMIVEDGWYYSFTAYVYKMLHLLFRGNTMGIAVFLAAVSTAAVYATERLVCLLWRGMERNGLTLLFSLSLNLVMPVYVKYVGEFRYVSYQSGNIWHNSTYICMRLAALAVLLYYFKLEEKYADGLDWREWCFFALLNVICTGIKPSFFLSFSPVAGVALLVDLFRKVPLKRILAFGSSLLPSGLVLFWQNIVLFGASTGNGIGFRPWYTFSLHTRIPKLAVICSALFCGLTVLVTWKKALAEKRYRFLVAIAVLGFLEALCLVENGSRAVDGNFLWGYSFCLSALFVVCGVKWLQMWRDSEKGMAVKLGLGLAYGWHLVCGVYFFVRLVLGASFWM